MKKFFRWLLIALGFIIGAEAAGLLGSLFIMDAVPTWYMQLKVPSFSPPHWLFTPLWTSIYCMMGLAAFFVFHKGWHKEKVRDSLSIFGLQLVLSAWWSIIFFGMHMPVLALLDILLLWVAIVVTMYKFFRVSETASFLLVPYLLWTTFAIALNVAIIALN